MITSHPLIEPITRKIDELADTVYDRFHGNLADIHNALPQVLEVYLATQPIYDYCINADIYLTDEMLCVDICIKPEESSQFYYIKLSLKA